MSNYAKPNNQWLADMLRKNAAGVAANSAQGTDYVTDSSGQAWAIIGNISSDNRGVATGIGSPTSVVWGIAVFNGSAWENVSSSAGGGTAYGRTTTDIASTTSMADVTGIGFAIGASEVWSFDIELYVTVSVTSSVSFQLIGPASPSSVLMLSTTSSASGIPVTAFSSAVTFGLSSTSSPFFIRLRGTIVNGANAGTVQLQWDDTTGAGDAVVKASSYLLATKGT